MDVGQAEVPPGMPIREFRMVQAQQMQDRRVQIVEVDLVLDAVVAVFIRLTVGLACLGTSAGEPHRESVRVVVPAVRVLGRRRAPELSTPDHKRLVKQASRLEVLEQARNGPVHLRAHLGETVLEIEVMVPAVAVALHEPYAALAEPPGHEALAAEVFGNRIVEAVEAAGRLAFAADVLDRGRFRLHPERQFEGGDAALEFAVQTNPIQVAPRDLLQPVEFQALQAFPLAIADERERGVLRLDVAVAERRALVGGREEGGAIVVGAAFGEGLADRDIARNVLVLRA